MTLKSPSIVSAAHFLIAQCRRRCSPPLLEYAPQGWRTVLPEQYAAGWNSSDVVAHERAKWEAFLSLVAGTGPLGFNHEHVDLSVTEHVPFHNINVTYGYVLARAAHGKTGLSVLDYGGGLGHYYQLGRALLPEVTLDYACKEVAQMAATGRRLNPGIAWYTDDACLGRSFDLVIVGGSLQYIERWQEFLRRLAQSVAGYLYLTGIPVTKQGDGFVAIQNGYDMRMLHGQFNREELLQVVGESGLTLLREFALEECPYIKNAPSQCNMRGWLFRKADGRS